MNFLPCRVRTWSFIFKSKTFYKCNRREIEANLLGWNGCVVMYHIDLIMRRYIVYIVSCIGFIYNNYNEWNACVWHGICEGLVHIRHAHPFANARLPREKINADHYTKGFQWRDNATQKKYEGVGRWHMPITLYKSSVNIIIKSNKNLDNLSLIKCLLLPCIRLNQMQKLNTWFIMLQISTGEISSNRKLTIKVYQRLLWSCKNRKK